jgi:thiol-disulfide isomerase/thioredoxin
MKHTALLILHTMFLSASTLYGEGITFFKGTWAEAVAQAGKENKALFVDFYAVWCGPCKYMDKNVFTDERVGEYFNARFISLHIDAEKEEPELVKHVGIEAYPTLAVFGPDGKMLSKHEGALEADELISKFDLIVSLDSRNDVREKFCGVLRITQVIGLNVYNSEWQEEYAEKLTEWINLYGNNDWRFLSQSAAELAEIDSEANGQLCLAWAQRAHKLSANAFTAWVLAVIYDKLGNYKESRRLLHRAIDLKGPEGLSLGTDGMLQLYFDQTGISVTEIPSRLKE